MVVTGMVARNRTRGRPSQRLIDDFIKWSNCLLANAIRCTKDRKQWKYRITGVCFGDMRMDEEEMVEVLQVLPFFWDSSILQLLWDFTVLCIMLLNFFGHEIWYIEVLTKC